MKGKVFDVGKVLGLQSALLKDKMGQRFFFKKDAWKSHQPIWEPYLRIDVLSVAFIYRQGSDKFHDFAELISRVCLPNSSLGWKIRRYSGQVENFFTYSH